MSRLVIRNRTRYPDAEVKQLVRYGFADLELPSRHSILVRVGYVRLSHWRRATDSIYGASGIAYDHVYVKPDVPRGAAYEVHLNVAREEDYPAPWYDPRPVPEHEVGELADWREALVAIAAHEGKHVEQFQRMPGRANRRAAGESHRSEEDRCNAEAARRVRRWRAER